VLEICSLNEEEAHRERKKGETPPLLNRFSGLNGTLGRFSEIGLHVFPLVVVSEVISLGLPWSGGSFFRLESDIVVRSIEGGRDFIQMILQKSRGAKFVQCIHYPAVADNTGKNGTYRECFPLLS